MLDFQVEGEIRTNEGFEYRRTQITTRQAKSICGKFFKHVNFLALFILVLTCCRSSFQCPSWTCVNWTSHNMYTNLQPLYKPAVELYIIYLFLGFYFHLILCVFYVCLLSFYFCLAAVQSNTFLFCMKCVVAARYVV